MTPNPTDLLLASLPVAHREAVAAALAAARADGAPPALVIDPAHVWPTVVWQTADALFVATARKQPAATFGDVAIVGSWRHALSYGRRGMRWSGAADAANGRPYGYWRGSVADAPAVIGALVAAGFVLTVANDYAAACDLMRQHEAAAPRVPAAKRAGRARGRTAPQSGALPAEPAAPAAPIDLAALIAAPSPTPPQG